MFKQGPVQLAEPISPVLLLLDFRIPSLHTLLQPWVLEYKGHYEHSDKAIAADSDCLRFLQIFAVGRTERAILVCGTALTVEANKSSSVSLNLNLLGFVIAVDWKSDSS